MVGGGVGWWVFWWRVALYSLYIAGCCVMYMEEWWLAIYSVYRVGCVIYSYYRAVLLLYSMNMS